MPLVDLVLPASNYETMNSSDDDNDDDNGQGNKPSGNASATTTTRKLGRGLRQLPLPKVQVPATLKNMPSSLKNVPLSVPELKARAKSSQEFKAIDLNHNQLACRDEMANYVASKAELWAMLSVNIPSLTEDDCRQIATRVVMELASGVSGPAAQEAELTSRQFHQFKKHYILDPRGSQEFFHRTVFAAFDADGNASLDENELDKFLDIFYEAGSIFKGDARLPKKHALKQLIYDKLDTNGDGVFSFDEIRSLISGSAMRGDLLG